MSGILDSTLPEPSFIDRDPAQVTAAMIAQYEADTGKTLFPAQVERLLINNIAYREALIREAVQDAAKQNLVRYASAPMLDRLGELVDCVRLGAAAATCTLQFTFDAPGIGMGVIIPAGTRAGQNVTFATDADVAIKPADTVATVSATCITTGAAANGYVAGQVSGLVDTVTGLNITAAQNVTTTAGGLDEESDDAYRERIVLAPERFSTAGPGDAYVYWARSASAQIVAVKAVYPALAVNGSGALVSANSVPPGCVDLYVLTRTGLPTKAILDAVLAACSPSNRRPLTDYVRALAPLEVDYQIVAELTLFSTADETAALTQAQTSAATYVATREQQIGLDVVREQIIGALNNPNAYGIYKVNLIQPAADQVLDDTQWGHCTGIVLTIAGQTDG